MESLAPPNRTGTLPDRTCVWVGSGAESGFGNV